jgi:hypothetical protein
MGGFVHYIGMVLASLMEDMAEEDPEAAEDGEEDLTSLMEDSARFSKGALSRM